MGPEEGSLERVRHASHKQRDEGSKHPFSTQEGLQAIV